MCATWAVYPPKDIPTSFCLYTAATGSGDVEGPTCPNWMLVPLELAPVLDLGPIGLLPALPVADRLGGGEGPVELTATVSSDIPCSSVARAAGLLGSSEVIATVGMRVGEASPVGESVELTDSWGISNPLANPDLAPASGTLSIGAL